MNGSTHRLFGACAGVGVGVAYGWPWQHSLAAAALAAFSAGGYTSPDVDQGNVWHFVDRVLPDEWLGRNGPLQHRGIAHWWGMPLAAFVMSAHAVPGRWLWVLHALLVGWVSHLVGDFVFGRAGSGRGPGVPLLPWWGHIGLGLKSGGTTEKAVAWCLPFVMTGEAVLQLRALRPDAFPW